MPNWKTTRPPAGYNEEAEYEKFVESMVVHCRCARNRPCDGVLAGGICDNIQDDQDEESDDPYNDRETFQP